MKGFFLLCISFTYQVPERYVGRKERQWMNEQVNQTFSRHFVIFLKKIFGKRYRVWLVASQMNNQIKSDIYCLMC